MSIVDGIPDELPTEWDLLNLGSGEDYRDGWTNLDYNERYDPDVVHDLNEEWPFDDDRFDHVLASHVFEHLDDPEHAFEEAGRILRDGGSLEVRVPLGINARTDITHQHEWTWDTALQFAQNCEAFGSGYQFDPSVPFELQEREVQTLHCHGPFGVTTPVAKAVHRIIGPGLWVSGWPGASAELVAVYRRVPDR